MLLTLSLVALLAPQASPSPRPSGRGERASASPADVPASEEPSPAPPPAAHAESATRDKEHEEPPVVTHHEARVGGRSLRYTVTTGTMPLKNEAGETEAGIFYMAYVADRAGGPEKRP